MNRGTLQTSEPLIGAQCQCLKLKAMSSSRSIRAQRRVPRPRPTWRQQIRDRAPLAQCRRAPAVRCRAPVEGKLEWPQDGSRMPPSRQRCGGSSSARQASPGAARDRAEGRSGTCPLHCLCLVAKQEINGSKCAVARGWRYHGGWLAERMRRFRPARACLQDTSICGLSVPHVL